MVRISVIQLLATGIGVTVAFVLIKQNFLCDLQEPALKRFPKSLKPENTKIFASGNGTSVLVTGGAGFLGSHLVDHLMQAGHYVVVLDNLSTGRKDNLAKWLHHPRFILIDMDINNPLEVQTTKPDGGSAVDQKRKDKGGRLVTIKKPICKHKRCKHEQYHPRFALVNRNDGRTLTMRELNRDKVASGISLNCRMLGKFKRVNEIYHLASPASVKDYMANPVFTIMTNTQGTLNILEFAKTAGAKVLLASTSEIYGDPSIVPQSEVYWGSVNPVGKRSSYSEGKRAAEAILTAYQTQYGVDTRIARISNTYGPRLPRDGGGVVSDFISKALNNSPIKIFGGGNQTRCLQYVSDAVQGMVKLMHSRFTNPVNIAGSECLTVKQLAHSVISSTGSRSKIVNSPPRPDDPKLRKPDITLANHVLHWKPKVTLKQGLMLTADYFKKHQKMPQEQDTALRFGS